MAKFQKGHPKIGGRVKGSKNKATLFKERIFKIITDRDADLTDMEIKDLAFIASRFVPREIKAEHSGEIKGTQFNVIQSVKGKESYIEKIEGREKVLSE